MSKKFNKCNCYEYVRDEDRHFLLTTHHPECKQFNPASELHGLEMQCRKFMEIIIDLRSKIQEMQKIADEADI